MSRLWFLLILIFLGFSPLIAELFRGGSSRSDKTVWIIFFLVIGSLIAVLTYWLIIWDYF
jgi:hypothetical protein